MTDELSDETLRVGTDFWATCLRLLTVYPQRPAKLSGDAEAKQLERQLRSLAETMLPLLCDNDNWLADASVGKGNWATVPWVAFFDSRVSAGAQQGVYPVIHLSSEEPVGIRIGLGVSATEFKAAADRKAAEVRSQFSNGEREALRAVGFADVVDGKAARVDIGAGNLSRKYAEGMIFERFLRPEELTATTDAMTESLATLVRIYKAWVDRSRHSPVDARTPFLEVMRQYADERVVFLSPSREVRYLIADVDHAGCTVNRLDSNQPTRVTEASYQRKRDWLREHGGSARRDELDNTVATHICYLQAADMALAADRKTAVYLDDDQAATDHFISLIAAIQTVTLYKPVILALVVEAIRDGELTENRIEFDWLLPRFIRRLHEHGHDVGEQQLAEGFGRMAGDLFWLHAYRDPDERLSPDKPTPSQIRNRISHARLQEPFWRAIQQPQHQQQVLAALAAKWWPDMTTTAAHEPSDLSKALKQVIDAIAASGFIYQPWQIATYVTALRTKPFVILAGVAGTGKSKLPALVSKLTGGNMTRISVRPDWTDSSDVLGYVDLADKFRPGVVLQAASEASEDRDRYHVCLIDEMNIARVEHYFAEVLSTIEDRSPAEDGGYKSSPLISQKLPTGYEAAQRQNLPPNLGIVGTVNMDESSHGFSRKVLDRAFTIELSDVDLSLDTAVASQEQAALPRWPVAYWHCVATRLSEIDHSVPHFSSVADRATGLLQEVNQCLVHSQLQVGYRTRDEVILFLVNARDVEPAFRTRDGQSVDPLDLAIMMKVLPRLVGGSNAIRKTLTGLMGLAVRGKPFSTEDEAIAEMERWEEAGRPDASEDAKLPRTASRLCLMWSRLINEGYTSFWL
ncbi:MrcB family domain-containing protein [Candidatus Laterigemmans baculatus]|uniref:MrcB family domain-containing protein n=1 Tax=Candidatus Laterigemmans baculatus TaxID=2770505 RepID=UPI0013DBAFB1|nr:DUF3578 domain-containing protein [Candidatus Laterigemmans baculatus]